MEGGELAPIFLILPRRLSRRLSIGLNRKLARFKKGLENQLRKYLARTRKVLRRYRESTMWRKLWRSERAEKSNNSFRVGRSRSFSDSRHRGAVVTCADQ